MDACFENWFGGMRGWDDNGHAWMNRSPGSWVAGYVWERWQGL